MIKTEKITFIIIVIALVLSFFSTTATIWAADKEKIEQEKTELRKMSKETLAQLYKLNPQPSRQSPSPPVTPFSVISGRK